jgi:competence protein ComEA
VVAATALAVVGAVVVAVVASSSSRADTRVPANDRSPDAPLPDLPFAGPTPSTSAPTAVVAHAAGAVARPGVYRLDSSARVADLIAAAGGITEDADGDRLNLAAVLVDGVRVYVPRRGELEVPTVDPSGPIGDEGPGRGGLGGSTGPDPSKVDLNRAAAAQLEELSGVGPSIAAAIVEHRERNGPFRSVDDLLAVRGIGPARLEDLRPHVRV